MCVCEDGFYPEEVIGVETNNGHLKFLMPRYKPNNANLNEERKFWVWPDKVDHHWLNKCAMEIRPALQIDLKISTRRIVVYQCANIELINKFTILALL